MGDRQHVRAALASASRQATAAASSDEIPLRAVCAQFATLADGECSGVHALTRGRLASRRKTKGRAFVYLELAAGDDDDDDLYEKVVGEAAGDGGCGSGIGSTLQLVVPVSDGAEAHSQLQLLRLAPLGSVLQAEGEVLRTVPVARGRGGLLSLAVPSPHAVRLLQHRPQPDSVPLASAGAPPPPPPRFHLVRASRIEPRTPAPSEAVRRTECSGCGAGAKHGTVAPRPRPARRGCTQHPELARRAAAAHAAGHGCRRAVLAAAC